MNDPSTPRDSATVILLRDRGAEAEVLLVQRHAASRAFGGAHVFAGGVVDPEDAADHFQAAAGGISPLAAAERLAEGGPPAAALAFWVAAIRELFEEAGILLARCDRQPLAFHDAAVRARFSAHRAALVAGSRSFGDIVVSEELDLATDALEYWSRWITPVNVPRRYDARFFVARLPADQVPLHDERETVATVWLTPAAALAESRAGRIVLAPPTVRTLEDLAPLGSVDRIVAAARERIVTPILPVPVDLDGRPAVLYPGDADYDDAVPGARLTGRTSGARNRLIMGDGGWESIRD